MGGHPGGSGGCVFFCGGGRGGGGAVGIDGVFFCVGLGLGLGGGCDSVDGTGGVVVAGAMGPEMLGIKLAAFLLIDVRASGGVRGGLLFVVVVLW